VRNFFTEALSLIVTYLSSKSVELNPVESLTSLGEQDELQPFLTEIEIRHSIAYLKKLQPVLEDINKRVSTKPRHVKELSKLPIRGRLDVSKYVASGRFLDSDNDLYPTIKSDISFHTPENILICNTLRYISRQLSSYSLKANTAESHSISLLYEWVHQQLRMSPWSFIGNNYNYERLLFETSRRLLKRQTGNQQAYQAFVEWYDAWRVKNRKLDFNDRVELVKGLLAFPTSPSFDEKVFEIWCLKYVAETFIEQGFKIVEGPLPLHKRSLSYIYKLQKGKVELLIWFQRMEPLGVPRWHYIGKLHKAFNGIPDIIVTSNNISSPLIIDAKYRMMESAKSEETYKMLGYLENFRDSFVNGKFVAVLMFIGNQHLSIKLEGPQNCSVSLLSVPILNHRTSNLQLSFIQVLEEWLECSEVK
jgi:hypothetical protein